MDIAPVIWISGLHIFIEFFYLFILFLFSPFPSFVRVYQKQPWLNLSYMVLQTNYSSESMWVQYFTSDQKQSQGVFRYSTLFATSFNLTTAKRLQQSHTNQSGNTYFSWVNEGYQVVAYPSLPALVGCPALNSLTQIWWPLAPKIRSGNGQNVEASKFLLVLAVPLRGHHIGSSATSSCPLLSGNFFTSTTLFPILSDYHMVEFPTGTLLANSIGLDCF